MNSQLRGNVAGEETQKNKLTSRGYVALAFFAWLVALFIWSAIRPSQAIFPSERWDTSSIIATLVFGLPILLGLVCTPVICGLKGKLGLALIGVLGVPFGGSLWSLISAIRIAKPNSWWAPRYYGPKEMAVALHRFGPRQGLQVIENRD